MENAKYITGIVEPGKIVEMRQQVSYIIFRLISEGFIPEVGKGKVRIDNKNYYDTLKVIVHPEMLTVLNAMIAQYPLLEVRDEI